jgi:ubiquinone/menaquinone biosynthesis C-methylase UbiE
MPEKHTDKIRRRYSRIAGIYDTIEMPMEKLFSGSRKELMREVNGRVLEVGVGTGKNLEYYPAGVRVTAIDFSPRMIDKAREKAAKIDRDIDLQVMDIQDMKFPDNSFDTVLTSCVFCSVPDPVKGLKEIRRVCKSGGKVVMLEHVRSHKPVLGPLMDLMNPVPVHIYGANINRETVENLKKAGFRNIEVRNLWLDIVKLIIIENEKSEVKPMSKRFSEHS